MGTVKKFEDLKVWQKARQLSKAISTIIERNDKNKDFKFFNQLSGSSGSIMDNIAEGFGRSSRKEFIQFLFIANGSVMETRSQLYRALDYNYINELELQTFLNLTGEISAMIFSLTKYLHSASVPGQKHK